MKLGTRIAWNAEPLQADRRVKLLHAIQEGFRVLRTPVSTVFQPSLTAVRRKFYLRAGALKCSSSRRRPGPSDLQRAEVTGPRPSPGRRIGRAEFIGPHVSVRCVAGACSEQDAFFRTAVSLRWNDERWVLVVKASPSPKHCIGERDSFRGLPLAFIVTLQ